MKEEIELTKAKINTVVEDSFHKELDTSRTGLSPIAKGHWPGMQDTLEMSFVEFSIQNRENEFGLNSWLFTIGAPRIVSRNKYMWPVVTAWLTEQEKGVYPNKPYGKIFAAKLEKEGWQVQLWHDRVSSDPKATGNYMGEMFQFLVEEGLQPADAHFAKSARWDNVAAVKPSRRLPPELVAEIIGHTIMGVGYTYRKEHDTYIIIHEGSELGRIMLSTQLNYGPYFSTAMPHKTGVGESYVPKSPQEGFQPVDDDISRFRRLIRMIHEHITQQIEINDMMNLWPSSNVGDGDVSVSSLAQQVNEDPTMLGQGNIPILPREYLELLLYLHECTEGVVNQPVNKYLPLKERMGMMMAAEAAAVAMHYDSLPRVYLSDEGLLKEALDDLINWGLLQRGRPSRSSWGTDWDAVLYPDLGFPIYMSLEAVNLVKRIFKMNAQTAVARQDFNDSGHYAYPREKRHHIAQEFRKAKAAGQIANMDSWARSNYQISGKTLRSYLKQFLSET